MPSKKSSVVDLNDELSAYDAISVIWGIPRHRVKSLIVSGAYGLGGAYKSFEQWQEQLQAWDEASEPVPYVTSEPQRAQSGRFTSTIKELMSFRGKKK